MSATVHDLISARARRGREPLHFADDIEALTYIARELDDIRTQMAGELLTPAEPLDIRLAQLRAVVGAVSDLYRHDTERTNH